MKKLWPKLAGDAALVRAVKKGGGEVVRDALSGKSFSLKPADFVVVSNWLEEEGVREGASSVLLREIALQHALSNIAFNHRPAFESFFDAVASKGAMESASKTLSASVGRVQSLAGLRKISSSPLKLSSGSKRHAALLSGESGKLCIQAASAMRHL